jgi:hypothetical protein
MQIANFFQPVAPLVYDIIGDLKRVTNSKGIADFNETPHQDGVWSPDATARDLYVISTLMREIGPLYHGVEWGKTTDADSDVKFKF